MINDDTIKLLRECNSGVKMGVISLDDVLRHVRGDENLEKRLSECKQEHESLGDETHDLLNEYHDTGKDSNPMAKGMSWMKTNMQLAMNDSDKTIADLITDGCNMGVKSLRKSYHKPKSNAALLSGLLFCGNCRAICVQNLASEKCRWGVHIQLPLPIKEKTSS